MLLIKYISLRFNKIITSEKKKAWVTFLMCFSEKNDILDLIIFLCVINIYK